VENVSEVTGSIGAAPPATSTRNTRCSPVVVQAQAVQEAVSERDDLRLFGLDDRTRRARGR